MTKLRPNCPLAHAADAIGDRWSLLILRNLNLDGPQGFQELSRALDTISPTTLSGRLKALQENGLVERQVVDAHPPRTSYALTETGKAVRPVLKALFHFGDSIGPRKDKDT